MAQIANDGTLIRGSFNITINGVPYVIKEYKRAAKARTEKDYDAAGKPYAANHVEDFDGFTGTIMGRSDQVIPPKFVSFAFRNKNWYLQDIEESGSAMGLVSYSFEAIEQINSAVVIS